MSSTKRTVHIREQKRQKRLHQLNFQDAALHVSKRIHAFTNSHLPTLCLPFGKKTMNQWIDQSSKDYSTQSTDISLLNTVRFQMLQIYFIIKSATWLMFACRTRDTISQAWNAPVIATRWYQQPNKLFMQWISAHYSKENSTLFVIVEASIRGQRLKHRDPALSLPALRTSMACLLPSPR